MVLVVALRFGRAVSAVVESPTSEVFLLRVLGIALLVAGIASQLQVSAGVGAFLLGIAISEDTAENATRVLSPLRDLFAAIFFVVFGLNTDPRQIPRSCRPRSCWPSCRRPPSWAPAGSRRARSGSGGSDDGARGAALVARGEFSIVIAGLALASGTVDPGLAPLATTYVLLMAILGPIAARVVEPVHARLSRPCGRRPPSHGGRGSRAGQL